MGVRGPLKIIPLNPQLWGRTPRNRNAIPTAARTQAILIPLQNLRWPAPKPSLFQPIPPNPTPSYRPIPTNIQSFALRQSVVLPPRTNGLRSLNQFVRGGTTVRSESPKKLLGVRIVFGRSVVSLCRGCAPHLRTSRRMLMQDNVVAPCGPADYCSYRTTSTPVCRGVAVADHVDTGTGTHVDHRTT